MRTQLRRQAAAHTDHVQDVLKVQEQELRADAEQVTTHPSNQTSEHTHTSESCEWLLIDSILEAKRKCLVMSYISSLVTCRGVCV